MKTTLDNTSDLLQKVIIEIASYNKAKNRYHDQISPEFSLFSLFKQNEMSISRCLAFLLNAEESHAQNNLFLRTFYQKFIPQYSYQEKHNIKLEVSINIEKKDKNGLRRLDIYVETKELIFAIENKPWAADSQNQLQDYTSWLIGQAKKKNKDWLLFYISTSEYSDYSLPSKIKKQFNENILYISYYEIKEWLDSTSPFIKSNHVKVFVEAFSKYINNNINYESDMELSNEIIELTLKNNQNLNAALTIAKNIPSIKSKIMLIFVDYIKSNIKNPNIHIDFNIDNFKAEKWDCGIKINFIENSKYKLVFIFNNSKLNYFFWGFQRIGNEPSRGATKNHDKIKSSMDKIFPQFKEYAKSGDINYPWWCEAEETLDFPNNWNTDDSVWSKLQKTDSNSLAAKIINIIEKVNKKFQLDLLK
ncbi:PD-(D/E)XK nuclease family protein [Morganella morganii]|uniref:PD-(D/E)XK nuclease family protein n=1 Tax=Morganella morganii TaxID=582 RepID=UPI003EB86ABF